ncbi:hypothetical protein GDO78_018970 [Eleutherodactylus coqui]|uniref:Taste receptor type 2 n=1 Tax=Eleutherodactylus coqui TaxID=57060 RepID=A0A8J6B8E1_ELECQ|nr:hypothetical protein GDO78_018970 [Eleutherodactylus coqui]
MAGATESDTDIQHLGLRALALITLIAGLAIHSFIIGVNVTDWWKGRSVTLVDHIVTSLAISRMGAQCVSTLYLYVDELFLRHLDSLVTLVMLSVIYDFFSCANVWLTSLLSIVFCLKISNFHTRLFLYLRGMTAHRTVCFTEPSSHLFFYYISSVLLFTTLYHHITKMKKSSNLSINLETYYSVMKYVSFSFIYNTVYFIVEVVCVYHYFVYCVFLLWLYTVMDFLPALHSSYLIYRTAKLRSQMSKVLQNIIDFLFQRKDTETRESIEVVAL